MVSNGTDVASNGRRYKRRRVGSLAWMSLLVCLLLLLTGVLVSGRYVGSVVDVIDGAQKIEKAFPAEADRPPSAIAGLETEPLNASGVKPAPAANADKPGSINILLIGEDEGGGTPDELVAGNATGTRSDTLMLVHIPADRNQVYVMSVMRDLWTEIPGHGKHKINSALAFGGIPLVVQSIEGLFNQRIDHIVVIDTDGFADLTDSLGGVKLDVPSTFDSYHKPGYTFHAGMQKLDGETALAFVRERYAFQDGDYQRVKNQQIYLQAVLSTLLSKDVLTHPLKIQKVIKEFVPYLAVDKNFSASAVVELALQLRNLRSDDVHAFTLPTDGTGTSADGQSIVLKDQSAIAGISQAMASGTLGDYLRKMGLVRIQHDPSSAANR